MFHPTEHEPETHPEKLSTPLSKNRLSRRIRPGLRYKVLAIVAAFSLSFSGFASAHGSSRSAEQPGRHPGVADVQPSPEPTDPLRNNPNLIEESSEVIDRMRVAAENSPSGIPTPSVESTEALDSTTEIVHLVQNDPTSNEGVPIHYTATVHEIPLAEAGELKNILKLTETSSLVSFSFTSDGQPFTGVSNQFGVTTYLVEQNLPFGVDRDTFMLSLSRFLHPKAIQDLVEVTGADIYNHYFESDSQSSQHRMMSMILANGGNRIYAYMPYDVTKTSIPSGLGGVFVATPSELMSSLEHFADVLSHEVFHGYGRAIGTREVNEMYAQYAQMIFVGRQNKYFGRDPEWAVSSYFIDFNSSQLWPDDRILQGIEPGYGQLEVAYNTALAARLMYDYAKKLGLDTTGALRPDNTYTFDFMSEAWTRFLQGHFRLRSLTSQTEYDKVMREVMQLTPGSQVTHSFTAASDGSVELAYQMSVLPADNAWQPIVEQMLQNPQIWLQPGMDDYFADYFVGKAEPSFGTTTAFLMSYPLTRQVEAWQKNLPTAYDSSSISEEVQPEFNLRATSTIADLFNRPNMNGGYRLFRVFDTHLMTNLYRKDVVISPTTGTSKCRVLIRNAAGTIVEELTDKPIVLSSAEQYFILVLSKDYNPDQTPDVIQPFVVGTQKSADPVYLPFVSR